MLELDSGETIELGAMYYAEGLEDNHKRVHLMALEGHLGAVSQITAIEDDIVLDMLKDGALASSVMDS